VTDNSANDQPEQAEAAEGPVADSAAPSGDTTTAEPERAPDEADGKPASSEDRPDDIGGDDDGGSVGQVGALQKSKQSGDRTIDQARRSAISQGDGPATYIEKQEITYSGRRVFVQKQILEDQDDLRRESETYVRVAGFDRMQERLDFTGMLLLLGEPGSGRNATARMLFLESDRRRVGTLSVNTDEGLFYLLHDHLTSPAAGATPLMSAGDGYIVEWTGTYLPKSSLKGFADAVKAAGARVVVIVDSSADTESPTSEFEQIHPWPLSRAEVMAKHLDVHLRDHRDCCPPDLLEGYRKQILDHHPVQSRLNLAPSVLRIVEMARFFGKNAHEIAKRGVGQLVSEWDDSARVLAREILRGEAPPEKPHLVPQQQAFRIAYTVFHEQPLAYVFDTADLLLEKLISVEVRNKPAKSRVFDRSVEALIHPRMAARTAGRDDDQPRCACLADESLMVSVLEVAWHEYTQLRIPLRAWLNDLAGRPNTEVRVRAAQIAGLLATFDYPGVFELMIKTWARGKAVFRDSAALAMDQIARHTPLESRVNRRIEEWTRSKLVTEQDTAARWYGRRADKKAVGKAVEELGTIGSRPYLRRGTGIAEAMSLLFLNGNVDEVVDALGRWIVSENPYLPHHAVRTLLILTDERGAAKRSREQLSELAAKSAEGELALVQMWHRALISRTVGGFAWSAMREWAIGANGDEDQTAVMESMADHVFTGTLVPRARFNLILWHKQRPDVELIGRLLARLSNSRGM
jgi:hypothetical protein